jgi:hypothetical protein
MIDNQHFCCDAMLADGMPRRARGALQSSKVLSLAGPVDWAARDFDAEAVGIEHEHLVLALHVSVLFGREMDPSADFVGLDHQLMTVSFAGQCLRLPASAAISHNNLPLEARFYVKAWSLFVGFGSDRMVGVGGAGSRGGIG